MSKGEGEQAFKQTQYTITKLKMILNYDFNMYFNNKLILIYLQLFCQLIFLFSQKWIIWSRGVVVFFFLSSPVNQEEFLSIMTEES